ncbi:MAG: TIGR04211 family SH3 domain-containing protein, partial [Woeseiaceae bacterium]
MRLALVNLTVVILTLLPLAAVAETAYVTDNLRLGLHQSENTSDRAFRMLDSGQALEVLYRDGNYANVQLPDGMQGFVKAAYLVSDKPARLIVAETIAERDALRDELNATKEALAEPAAAIAALESQRDELSTSLANAQSQVADLQEQNESLSGLQERYKGSLPLSWVAVALAVVLVAGFLLGN